MRLSIGQKVKVKAVLDFYYNDDSERVYQRNPVDFEAWVTGAANKPLGIYYPPKRTHDLFGDVDDEPARLDIKSTVLVYRVRQRIFGREFDVLPIDLLVHGGGFQ